MSAFIGVDQYGDVYWIDKYPRKELMKQLDRRYAHKMYVDKRDGSTTHIGYVIRGLWIRVFGLEGNVFERRDK